MSYRLAIFSSKCSYNFYNGYSISIFCKIWFHNKTIQGEYITMNSPFVFSLKVVLLISPHFNLHYVINGSKVWNHRNNFQWHYNRKKDFNSFIPLFCSCKATLMHRIINQSKRTKILKKSLICYKSYEKKRYETKRDWH